MKGSVVVSKKRSNPLVLRDSAGVVDIISGNHLTDQFEAVN